MSSLLELREKLKAFYSKNDVFINPVLKFLLAFFTLTLENGRMGYMERLDSLAIVLVVSLLCSFLPIGCITLFAGLFGLLHLYALSMETALVALCIYLVVLLLVVGFHPKGSILLLLTPLLMTLKIPYILPIAAGLLLAPASGITIGCGVLIYYVFYQAVSNAQAISSMKADETTAKLRLMIDGLIDNKTMLVMIAAFLITVAVVYLIRRMSIDYAWMIAAAAGGVVDLVVLLAGALIFDTNMSIPGAIFGTLLAMIVAVVLQFFFFCVDYTRTEKVQFEDDEYYYYVKAVPKMNVAAAQKTVKKINSQRRYQSDFHRTAGGSRSVITERTSVNRRQNGEEENLHSRNYRNRSTGSSKSVSINSNMVEDASQEYDDFEDL